MESQFKDFLERFRAEVEKTIKNEVASMGMIQRSIMQSFMPLYINLFTDAGKACLVIQKSFDVTIENPSNSPDVLVEGDFSVLKELFANRDSNSFKKAEQEGKIKLSSFSFKGQQALNRIREYLSGR